MNKYYVPYVVTLFSKQHFSFIIIDFTEKALTISNFEKIKKEIVVDYYERHEIVIKQENITILGMIKLDE